MLCKLIKAVSIQLTMLTDVIFPPDGQMKLPPMPAEPTYDLEKGEKKYKTTKRMIEVRGVEEVHTELIHGQYGIAAVTGGFISSADFAFVQVCLTSCSYFLQS